MKRSAILSEIMVEGGVECLALLAVEPRFQLGMLGFQPWAARDGIARSGEASPECKGREECNCSMRDVTAAAFDGWLS